MNVQYNGPASMVEISMSSYYNMACIKRETLRVPLQVGNIHYFLPQYGKPVGLILILWQLLQSLSLWSEEKNAVGVPPAALCGVLKCQVTGAM